MVSDQASAEGEGTLRIVLDLADRVGTALAGGRSQDRAAEKIAFPGGVGDIDAAGTAFDCHLLLPLFGGIIAAGSVVIYADFKAGVTHGTVHRSGDWECDGPCFGSEGGFDLYMGKSFVLGLRPQYLDAKVDFNDAAGAKATTASLFASAGFRF
jgi:hypothetical protein